MGRTRAFVTLFGIAMLIAVAVATARPRGQLPPSAGGSNAQRPGQIPAGDGAGAMSGTVVDAVTDRPIPGAVVRLNPGPRESNRPSLEMTDALGRFVFIRLPAFDGFTLSASKPGYASPPAGGATRMTLTNGQWLANLKLLLTRVGAIEGTVTDEYGDPVVGVYVRVLPVLVIAGTARPVFGPLATTDDRGHYRVANLSAGKYFVALPSVQSTLSASYTDAVDGFTPESTLPARPGGYAPRVFFPVDPGGGDRLVVGPYPTAPSDTRGPMAYPPLFYPNATTMAAATTIDLGDSETKLGIDLRLTPVHAARVSGRVDGPPEAVAKLALRLLPADTDDLGKGWEVATTDVATNGAFTFLNVPPGAYVISARRTISGLSVPTIRDQNQPTPVGLSFRSMIANGVSALSGSAMLTSLGFDGPSGFWGEASIEIANADVDNVIVRMQAGAHLAGRVVWDGPSQPTGGAFSALSLDPAARPSLGLPREDVTARGTDTFLIPNVEPGAYFLRTLVGSIESIRWHGDDYTNRPFDLAAGQSYDDVLVTLTGKTTTVAGYVRDAQGQLARSAAVIAVPPDRALWTNFGFMPTRLRSVRASTAGEYQFQNLPAGAYVLIAVDAAHVNAWQDPAFLERAAPGATEISVDWGGAVTKDLTMTVVKP